ncbi:MAG: hypothetical protein U5L96_01275 [Owenweeksia sp.]|nr:hypothetical protein [Owenweeksia sp.]
MKKFIILNIIWATVACQATNDDLEGKKTQLADREKQVATLNQEIRDLKRKLLNWTPLSRLRKLPRLN